MSSCYVGLRKPESAIYRMAIEITQKNPEDSCFIDDRALNLEPAAKLGLRTIQMQSAEQLKHDLEKMGVSP